jgi:hypothetical protein
MNILAAEWRVGREVLGFVAVEILDATVGKGAWTAYVGVSREQSSRTDAETVVASGARLSRREAAAFFPQLDPDKYVGQAP